MYAASVSWIVWSNSLRAAHRGDLWIQLEVRKLAGGRRAAVKVGNGNGRQTTGPTRTLHLACQVLIESRKTLSQDAELLQSKEKTFWWFDTG